MRRYQKARRGVVLLVVLTLLVLFTLLMVTFVIVAGQYKTAAEASTHFKTDDSEQLLDFAFHVLARDTPDPQNVMRGHSLLLDLYGMDGFTGEVQSVGNISGDGTDRQFFEISLTSLKDLTGSTKTLSSINGYYNGQYLTPVDGFVSGLTYRIVGFDGINKFTVMSGRSDGYVTRPRTADRVVVSGRPFNGTGFGYESSGTAARQYKLNTTALQPNRRGDSGTALSTFLTGGPDESYDAADFQNMALAAILPDRTNTPISPTDSTNTSRNSVNFVIPSFHRPALVNYWHEVARAETAGTEQTYWKSGRDNILFRPMAWNHPNFTGSNVEFTFGADGAPGQAGADDDGNGVTDYLADGTPDRNEIGYFDSDDITPLGFGPWDVDNDGDGIPDSLWLDLNAPPREMPGGYLAKPLFAILCVDLDGRLNLNANGAISQVTTNPDLLPITDANGLARGQASSGLLEGQGYGPPEINMDVIFYNGDPGSGNQNEYEKVLRGDASKRLVGRYGWDQSPGVSSMDLLSGVKFFEFPDSYFANHQSSYQTPVDLFGELAFGLDYRGQPQYDRPVNASSVVRSNVLDHSAYEANLSLDGAVGDTPFSVAELERLLRYQDPDVRSLPSRLVELTAAFDTRALAASNRRMVTTDSFSLPVPHCLSPPDLKSHFNGRQLSILDIVRKRLLDGGIVSTSIDTELRKLLSPDLVLGGLMDINRPFGNGRDDNSNGVVDEHGPRSTQQLEAAPAIAETIWSGIRFDHDNDGNTTTVANAYLARQQFARHLYVLMMSFYDTSGTLSTTLPLMYDINGNGTTTRAELAQSLAQYAVNVVDFRDADSIITHFEYDLNPFNGWIVDGNLVTDEATDGVDNDGDTLIDAGDPKELERRVVWGCERPEMLITETLAFHDRRIEDLTTPQGQTTKVQGMMMGIPIEHEDDATGAADPNNDFDQRLRPRGAAYIELYNPWTSLDERRPAEFYTGGTTPGIDLARLDGTTSTDPVWRFAVTAPGSTIDIDDPNLTTPVAIERVVYFGAGGTQPTGATKYNAVGSLARLLPGRHAVVGTYHLTRDEPNPIDGNTDGVNEYVSILGRRSDPATMTDISQTRRIVMHAGTNPLSNWLHVEENGNQPTWLPAAGVTPASPTYVADMQAPVTIPVANFNISESSFLPDDPNGDPFGTTTHPTTGEPVYTEAYDEPFDRDRFPTDTTYKTYKRIHLQRLANPLLPHNSATNPYRTIDAMDIDLTVFNGMAGSSGPNTTFSAAGTDFQSRERGATGAGAVDRDLWGNSETPPGNTGTSATLSPTHYFAESLVQSLGGLNATHGLRYKQDRSTPANPTATTAPTIELVGAPDITARTPFSWLTWNNRPFVNNHELMLVPAVRASQLRQSFSVADTAPPQNPYATIDKYSHLQNFFDTSSDGAGINGADLHRLFEYTHVPSRFVGTETWLNPTVFDTGNGTDYLHPPFNRISRLRVPGKINLNTVYDDRVWDAILGNAGVGPAFDSIVDSRRGYGTTGTGLNPFDDRIPTFFANPFRSADASTLVPLSILERASSEATLFRSAAPLPATAPYDAVPATTPFDPLVTVANTAAYTNTDRNPYFRYRQLNRIANLVTTQSNVYAVWVTVGFFEVDPVTGELGQENGLESGTVERHRAFYVLDRSIPVAFEPGKNHNLDKAILLRRIIE